MIYRRGRRGLRRGRRVVGGWATKTVCAPLRHPLRPLRFLSVFILALGIAVHSYSQQTNLLEIGGPGKPIVPTSTPIELTVVTYNIRWRAGDELKQIANWSKKRHPAVIALQEVDRARKRTGNTNTARALADELGMFYAWAAPPSVKATDEEETGVELLSPYPLVDVVRIILPNKGPGGRSRVALGATIKLGTVAVRVYSVHAENRMAELKKVEQLQSVLSDLDRYPKTMPAIVMGDFNTWERPMIGRTRTLFSNAGFTTPFPDEDSTFHRDIAFFDLELKLDWIWLRGFESQTSDIDRGFTVSDHFPLSTVVTLKQKGEPPKSVPPAVTGG